MALMVSGRLLKKNWLSPDSSFSCKGGFRFLYREEIILPLPPIRFFFVKHLSSVIIDA